MNCSVLFLILKLITSSTDMMLVRFWYSLYVYNILLWSHVVFTAVSLLLVYFVGTSCSIYLLSAVHVHLNICYHYTAAKVFPASLLFLIKQWKINIVMSLLRHCITLSLLYIRRALLNVTPTVWAQSINC